MRPKKKKTELPVASPLIFARIDSTRLTKGEKRKQLILDAMIDAIAKKGLDETSFDTIGKTTKMLRTHVSYYFSNREEMIRSTFEYTIQSLQRVTVAYIEGAKNDKQRFQRTIEAPFVWLKKYPKFGPVIALMYYYCAHKASFKPLQDMLRQMGEKRHVGCLEPWVQAKKITRAQAVALARLIQTIQTGYLVQYFNSHYPHSIDQLKNMTVATAFKLLDSESKR